MRPNLPIKNVNLLCAFESGDVLTVPIYNGKELYSTSADDQATMKIIKHKTNEFLGVCNALADEDTTLRNMFGLDSLISFCNLYHRLRDLRPGIFIDGRGLRRCIMSQRLISGLSATGSDSEFFGRTAATDYILDYERTGRLGYKDPVFNFLHNEYVEYNVTKIQQLSVMGGSKAVETFEVVLDEVSDLAALKDVDTLRSLFSLDSNEFDLLVRSLRKGFCLAFFSKVSDAEEFCRLLRKSGLQAVVAKL